MDENLELYSKYQIYFNKLFEQYGYEYHLFDVDNDNDINYFIKLTTVTAHGRPLTLHVLVYINVTDKELTLFTLISKNMFISPNKTMRSVNSFNAELSYGKLYYLKNKINYMAKIKLPNNINFFESDVIAECLFEIRHVAQNI